MDQLPENTLSGTQRAAGPRSRADGPAHGRGRDATNHNTRRPCPRSRRRREPARPAADATRHPPALGHSPGRGQSRAPRRPLACLRPRQLRRPEPKQTTATSAALRRAPPRPSGNDAVAGWGFLPLTLLSWHDSPWPWEGAGCGSASRRLVAAGGQAGLFGRGQVYGF